MTPNKFAVSTKHDGFNFEQLVQFPTLGCFYRCFSASVVYVEFRYEMHGVIHSVILLRNISSFTTYRT